MIPGKTCGNEPSLGELVQRDGATEVMDQFIDPEGEIFAFTDPPRHRELRKVLMVFGTSPPASRPGRQDS